MIWAIHPYATGLSRSYTVYDRFLKATRGKVWFTEAGAFQHRYHVDPDTKQLSDSRTVGNPSGDPNLNVPAEAPFNLPGGVSIMAGPFGTGLVRDRYAIPTSKTPAYCVYKNRTSAPPRHRTC